jgi:leader peptidase (prepilin peptidase)/N-methyltransferase
MLYILLVWVFLVGITVGSLLNVCIYRIPLEKSTLWPGSRCGHCYQRIRWYDNIPLLSFVLLRGRCRTCGVRFSARYFLIELFTGLSFVSLFYLEVVLNIHDFNIFRFQANPIFFMPSLQEWVVFGCHAVLISYLIVASFCDLDTREIPLTITVPGTLIGLVFAITFPWPWPYAPAAGVPPNLAHVPWWRLDPNLAPKQGLYPWPFWGPLPGFFAPGGNWQTGLATGLAGLFAGTLLLRGIRFLFSLGLGVEALGLGDADLMMMAGSFLGWQPTVVAFFIGVFAGLFFGLSQLLTKGDNMLPFGPGLAIGIVITFLCWRWIGPHLQMLFFNGPVMLALLIVGALLMLVASYALRILRH